MTRLGFDEVDANKYSSSQQIFDIAVWNQMLSGGNPVRKRVAFALSQFLALWGSNMMLTWRAHAVDRPQ